MMPDEVVGWRNEALSNSKQRHEAVTTEAGGKKYGNQQTDFHIPAAGTATR